VIVAGLELELCTAKGVEFSVVLSQRSGLFSLFWYPSSRKIQDSLLSVAEYCLLEHLVQSQITADQIRTCPECGSLFLSMSKPRTDRKRYCPYGRCAGNAATRAYRERESKKLKAKERIRSADRYERKVRKVFPKAKIKKRAHKTNKIDITKGGKPKKRMKSTE